MAETAAAKTRRQGAEDERQKEAGKGDAVLITPDPEKNEADSADSGYQD